MLFKINGERNSGTNFLYEILRLNNLPSYQLNIVNKTVFHWKHGIPTKHNKELDNRVIDIFIFRELESWLQSFFISPYHLTPFHNFTDFLTKNQVSMENDLLDFRTGDVLNKDDNNKTIFEIREYKFKKIMEYKKDNKDVILVSLSFLQDEKNLLQFLTMLCEQYSVSKPKTFITRLNHTKSKLDEKNRNHNIDINSYKHIINSKKNKDIEDFINNLNYVKV